MESIRSCVDRSPSGDAGFEFVLASAREVLLSFELELEDWYEFLGFEFEPELDLLNIGLTG